MSIVLYQVPPSAPCRAVIMTGQHLGIEFEKKFVDLFNGDHLKPEYLAINPLHTVPTIDDDGFILWDSHAIMAYLANKYAPDNPVYPQDPKERAVVDRMFYFNIGTLNKAQIEYLFPKIFLGQPVDPEKEEPVKKALELLEQFLEQNTYVAGDHLTLADFSIVATLSFLEEVGEYSLASYPKISAWLQNMKTEIPNYEEINEVPLRALREFINSRDV